MDRKGAHKRERKVSGVPEVGLGAAALIDEIWYLMGVCLQQSPFHNLTFLSLLFLKLRLERGSRRQALL